MNRPVFTNVATVATLKNVCAAHFSKIFCSVGCINGGWIFCGAKVSVKLLNSCGAGTSGGERDKGRLRPGAAADTCRLTLVSGDTAAGWHGGDRSAGEAHILNI